MENSLHYVSIPELRSSLSFADSSGLGDDFFVAEIQYSEKHTAFQYPFRFDGYMAMFVVSAKAGLGVDIDLNHYDVSGNAMIFFTPGNIIRIYDSIRDTEEMVDTRVVVVALSKDYVGNIHFDFNKLVVESLSILNHPYVELSESDIQILARYLDTIHEVLGRNLVHKKDIMGSLLSSIFYLIASLWTDKLAVARVDVITGDSTRAHRVFRNFLDLVTEYHGSQRGMGFYAQKLNLTPKYLSKLVKQVSGRSGPDWIDAFVILEAKNLLKYSGSNIKEIVYRLNFPNQSVFYKFFKAHTGMTPSEYRNS